MKHDGVEADDEEERQKVGRDEEDGLKEEREMKRADSGNARAAPINKVYKKAAAVRIPSSYCFMGAESH